MQASATWKPSALQLLQSAGGVQAAVHAALALERSTGQRGYRERGFRSALKTASGGDASDIMRGVEHFVRAVEFAATQELRAIAKLQRTRTDTAQARALALALAKAKAAATAAAECVAKFRCPAR